MVEAGAVNSSTHHDGSGKVHERPLRGRVIRDIHCSSIKAHRLFLGIVHHDDACEVGSRQLTHGFGLLGLCHFVIFDHGQFETVVGGQAEGEVILLVSVREECHLASLDGRLDEHVYTQVGERQFALCFRAGIMTALSIEIERGGLRDTRVVGYAEDLEVIVLVQPITGDGFAKAHRYIVLERQDTVGGTCLAEQYGRTGVFRTADDRRSLADEARSVAAVGDGTQVVVQFFRIALAVEAESLDAAVLYLGFVACRLVIQAVVGIERALGYPGIVVLRRELVLELDMIEVLMMDIEAIDGNGQVVAYRVACRQGIHHPFIARIGDADGRGLRHIVDG